MESCEKCGRPLEGDEDKLCPSCKSKKSYRIKKWVEGLGGGLLVLSGIVKLILNKKRK